MKLHFRKFSLKVMCKSNYKAEWQNAGETAMRHLVTHCKGLDDSNLGQSNTAKQEKFGFCSSVPQSITFPRPLLLYIYCHLITQHLVKPIQCFSPSPGTDLLSTPGPFFIPSSPGPFFLFLAPNHRVLDLKIMQSG